MDLRFTTAVEWIRDRDTRRAWRVVAAAQRAADRLARTTDAAEARDVAGSIVRDAIALLILAGGNGSDVLRAVERLGREPNDPDPGGTVGERGAREETRRGADPGEPTDPYGYRFERDVTTDGFRSTSGGVIATPPPGDARPRAPYPNAYADPAFADAEFTDDD